MSSPRSAFSGTTIEYWIRTHFQWPDSVSLIYDHEHSETVICRDDIMLIETLNCTERSVGYGKANTYSNIIHVRVSLRNNAFVVVLLWIRTEWKSAQMNYSIIFWVSFLMLFCGAKHWFRNLLINSVLIRSVYFSEESNGSNEWMLRIIPVKWNELRLYIVWATIW